MMDKPKLPPRGKARLAPMPTEPGDYLSGGSTRDSYAKTMQRPAIEKDVKGGGFITPPTFQMKKNAKKTGGFKGFKI